MQYQVNTLLELAERVEQMSANERAQSRSAKLKKDQKYHEGACHALSSLAQIIRATKLGSGAAESSAVTMLRQVCGSMAASLAHLRNAAQCPEDMRGPLAQVALELTRASDRALSEPDCFLITDGHGGFFGGYGPMTRPGKPKLRWVDPDIEGSDMIALYPTRKEAEETAKQVGGLIVEVRS